MQLPWNSPKHSRLLMVGIQSTSDEDLECLTNIQVTKKSPSALPVRTLLEAVVGIALLATFSSSIGLAVRLSALRARTPPQPECLHALGGGPVGLGGGMQSAAPMYCRQQLVAYADPVDGAYWLEVQLAAHSAMVVFGFGNGTLQALKPKETTHKQQQQQQGQQQQGQQLHGAQVRALPHTEVAELYTPGSTGAPPTFRCAPHKIGPVGPDLQIYGHCQAGASQIPSNSLRSSHPLNSDKRKLVVFDIDETLLSNMEQILNPEEWPWDKWVRRAQAPALAPVHRFYQALCSAGFAVAMVTGRKEAARQHTMQNLLSAGYGTMCSSNYVKGTSQTTEGKSSFQRNDISATLRSVVGQEGSSVGNSSSIGNSGSVSSNSSECCYEALFMRPPNDTRLASVYKPWARQQLLSSVKYELIALVGDQFSDLNGQTSAPYAFKLPNPFYYIL